MSLTAAQQTTLAAHIKANQDATVVAALATRNDGAIAEWYNVAGAFIAWKKVLTPQEARKAITSGAQLGQLDNLTAGKRESLLWVFGEDTDATNADVRTAIQDLCGTQNVLKAAILAAMKRALTRAEALFATGTGTDATPGTIGWEGWLQTNDVSYALNANP